MPFHLIASNYCLGPCVVICARHLGEVMLFSIHNRMTIILKKRGDWTVFLTYKVNTCLLEQITSKSDSVESWWVKMTFMISKSVMTIQLKGYL